MTPLFSRSVKNRDVYEGRLDSNNVAPDKDTNAFNSHNQRYYQQLGALMFQMRKITSEIESLSEHHQKEINQYKNIVPAAEVEDSKFARLLKGLQGISKGVSDITKRFQL